MVKDVGLADAGALGDGADGGGVVTLAGKDFRRRP
jgi:hypothetical protein